MLTFFVCFLLSYQRAVFNHNRFSFPAEPSMNTIVLPFFFFLFFLYLYRYYVKKKINSRRCHTALITL